MHPVSTWIHAIGCLLASAALAACSGGAEESAPPGDTEGYPSDYPRLLEKTTVPAARAVDGRLYVHGGHAGVTHETSTATVLSAFRRLDLGCAGGAWEERAAPGGPIQQGSLFEHGGRLYRLGGLTAMNAAGEPPDLHSLDDFAVYDAAADAWEDLRRMPETRASHDVVVSGGTLYVIGGWRLDGAPETGTYRTRWLSLDLTDDDALWMSHEQPFQTRDPCVGAARGKVYVLGGIDETNAFPIVPHVYDPATKSWSEGPALPTRSPIGGFGCAAATVGDTLYFSAGEGIVYRLNEAGDGWTEVASLKVPRLFHRLVARGPRELIAVGGGVGEYVEAIDSVESIPLE